jgi:hypothetical protein
MNFRFLCLSLLLPLTGFAHTLTVAPAGPIKTLEQARDAVRAWKTGEGKDKNEAVQVKIEQGTYAITQPIVFGPQDGGTATAPVTYEAAPGASPVISGGRVIKGWRQEQDGLWVADVPEVATGSWYFQELWINGRRAMRARTPNVHNFHAERPAEENRAGVPPMDKPDHTAFFGAAKDLQPLAALSQQEQDDAEVVVFQTWQIARHRVEFLDAEAGYVQFTAPSRWPFVVYEPRQRYFIENTRYALDAPGEWFLSREGKLHYMPLPGEDMGKAEVIAPVAAQLILMQGDPANGKFIEHLHFKGLALRHTGYLTGNKGHIDSQADSQIPAVVMMDGVKNVSLEDCEVAHTGIYGVWFRKGCTDSAMLRCHLHDLGAGGVRIGEGSVDSNPLCRTKRITVDNNIIQNGGRYFMGSVGVFVQSSGENVVTHNDIGDFFYTGISAGWVWGYAESQAHHNKFDFNHIHHLGYGVLSDMGGFYGLGPAAGTTVSNNHIHHVSGYRYGGWGLYTDEGSSGVLMENNLVHHTRHATFHQHYGKDNIVRNNILVCGEEAQIQRSKSEEHHSFTYTNNIVYFKEGLLFYGQWNKPRVRMEQNLYWDAGGRALDFGGKTFEQWQKEGYDRGSRIGDPLFVNAEAEDYRLKPESPALAMGFKPFDHTKSGVYGDEAWVKLAASRKYPQIEIEPLPLFTVDDDFEKTPVGKSIYLGRVHTEGKGDSLSVSEEQASSGKRSLKITDAPGLKQRYNPHFNFDVNHESGVSTVSFDLWLEPGAEFSHEWRDKQPVYFAGPSLEIRKGQLKAAGKVLLALPERQWIKLVIKSSLGEQASSKWTLTVTSPDGTKEFPDLPTKHAAWKTLEALIFSSEANVATSFYLDNLEVKNEAVKP